MNNKKEEANNDFELSEEMNGNENIESDTTMAKGEDVSEISVGLKELDENNELVEENGKKDSFVTKLLASVLDQVFCAGISVIILFIISLLLPIFGYRLVLIGKYVMFIVIYIIVNILYFPIMSVSKLKNTLGKGLLKL